jgi:hypothetical protein
MKQQHALELLLGLLTSPGACSSYSEDLCRVLNLCTTFVHAESSHQVHAYTRVLQALVLQVLGVACSELPFEVCTRAKPVVHALLAALAQETQYCCESGLTGFDSQRSTLIFEAVERLLLFASPMLEIDDRTQIEGRVCALLRCVSCGVRAAQHADRRLRRPPLPPARAHPGVRLAILRLGHIEAHTLQVGGCMWYAVLHAYVAVM